MSVFDTFWVGPGLGGGRSVEAFRVTLSSSFHHFESQDLGINNASHNSRQSSQEASWEEPGVSGLQGNFASL